MDYETELRRLARFVPESERTEELLAHRFEDGLSVEIRSVIGTVGVQDMRILVTAAEKAESIVAE